MSTRIVSVRVGTSEAAKGGHHRKVNRIILHERFNARRSFDNDVAVLVLQTILDLGGTVDKAAIAPKGFEVPVNVSVTTVGWGTMETGKHSDTLLEVSFPTVDNSWCTQQYKARHGIVTERMICAGLIGVGGVDSCQGDSGGPLIYQHVVIGVVSFGIDCGHSEYPGVYAKVSSYTDWVENKVNNSRAVSAHEGIISLFGPVTILLIEKY